MSEITSVNVGSLSLKFQLSEIPSEETLASGIARKIGFEDTIFIIKVNGEKIKKVLPIPNHTETVNVLLEILVEYRTVNSLDEITGTGRRVIHSGEIFRESVPVTESVVEKLASLNDLASLHNPAGLVGCDASKSSLSNCKHAFVFDTTLYSTVPRESYIYALPMKYYDEYEICRYDFHGTGHRYVSLCCAELTNEKVGDTETITCHLGNGASITAADGGESISTSMGFTPLAGVMMGTYCGDIDLVIVTYIMKGTGATLGEMSDTMNMQSGIPGVSSISFDTRDIEDGYKEGNPAVLLTAEAYVDRVINVVGGYYAQLGSVSTIIFTGGIGENDTNMRKMTCDRLSVVFGIQLDEELDGKTRGKEAPLSTVESKVAVWLIPTNEELVIARDIYRLIA